MYKRQALQEAAPLGPFAPQGSGGTPGAGYAPSAVCTPQAPRRKKRGWKIALAVGLPLVLLGGFVLFGVAIGGVGCASSIRKHLKV